MSSDLRLTKIQLQLSMLNYVIFNTRFTFEVSSFLSMSSFLLNFQCLVWFAAVPTDQLTQTDPHTNWHINIDGK